MQNKGITLSNFLPFDCRCTVGLSLVRGMRQWYVFEKVLGGCPVRNEQRYCSAAEWLQEALQKSCKSAGLQQPQILAAVESPLTAINSAFAAVQKIPESRSALQSGCKVASKRQGMLLPVMAYHSLVQKKKKCRLQ